MTARRLCTLLFLVLTVSLFAASELRQATAEDHGWPSPADPKAYAQFLQENGWRVPSPAALAAYAQLQQALAEEQDKEKAKDKAPEKIKELFKEVDKTKDKEPEKIKEMPKLKPDPVQELVGKNKDLIPVLVAALRDGDPEVRQTTAYTLVNLGKEAVPALTVALGNKDPELRANAAIVLGQFGKLAQEALPALLQAMKDPDPEVRRRVIYAISRIVEASSSLPSSENDWRRSWGKPQHDTMPAAAVVPTSSGRPRDPGLLLKGQKEPQPKPLPPLER